MGGVTFCLANTIDDGLKAINNGDYQKAAVVFQKACDDGVASGCFNIGLMYHKGLGVNQNYQKALNLYKKACDNGEAGGCYNAGFIYGKGLGVIQNITKAKKFLDKACDLGYQPGCEAYFFSIIRKNF